MPTETGRVVVGIADTVAGYQALRYAVARARERGGQLVAVRAFMCSSRNAPWRDVLTKKAKECIRKVFNEALGGLPAGLKIESVICDAEVATALIKIADQVDDLLVIGGSGGRRLIGWRRARVARRCSREANCPVVIVPPPAMARRSVNRLAREVVREADTFLTPPPARPAILPPGSGRDER
jgi:nucleotide-binding universal stress UspA family protein